MEAEQLVEIFDNQGRTIMVTPLASAIKRKLAHRAVFACLKDNQKRVYITKAKRRSASRKGIWDISLYSDVLVGESAEGACLRKIKEIFSIERIKLQEVASLPFMSAEGCPLNATFFLVGPVSAQLQPNPLLLEDGFFASEEELQGLLYHQSDMFSTMLAWAMRSGWIFKSSLTVKAESL